ncbi:hypothetical protein CHS0354_038977 [Potamilus streckersoni]|uniref:Uncharacterized protein n=1 Tax=Potamilus streckersoni TaxID=2493646 RepID=A0AAE0S1I2_9BIVA|nr:hypothetical protein CHS0354_038977 [Potamilus streckersoni]
MERIKKTRSRTFSPRLPILNSSIVNKRYTDLLACNDENEHRYWGVLVLPSNRVLLIDRSHNQCRIFDSYIGNHLTDFDLKSEPFGACVLNENQPQGVQVAVAVWNGEIQILSLCSNVQDTNTRRMKTIKTKLECCHSLATWTNDKLVLSGEYNSKLCCVLFQWEIRQPKKFILFVNTEVTRYTQASSRSVTINLECISLFLALMMSLKELFIVVKYWMGSVYSNIRFPICLLLVELQKISREISVSLMSAQQASTWLMAVEISYKFYE